MYPKKSTFLLGIIFICSSLTIYSQKYDYIWLYGAATNAQDLIEGSRLDFNYQPVRVDSLLLNMKLDTSNGIVCDENGDLLFYTNGCWIADQTHNMMQNGDNINPGQVHDLRCAPNDIKAYTAGPQSCLILPLPDHPDTYYLFHKRIFYDEEFGFDTKTGWLLFSVVNMSLNNGLGAVTQKNQVLITDTLTFGQLTAVKHANGRDWWIMDSEYLSNKYYSYLLTPTGIEGPFEQSIGNPTVKAGQGSGQANFSPDGTQYVRYTPQDDLFLFDFDRATGQLSNFRYIPITEEVEAIGGAVFSPNSRFLYIASFNSIYQFDTNVVDIASTQSLVAEWNGISSPFPTRFWNAQLGPDCRIYVYCPSCDVIGVINHPDEPGLGCQVVQQAVQLPHTLFRSMPHFPNYRLGPSGEEGVPCTPVVSVQEQVMAPEKFIRIYPNPANSWIKVQFSNQVRIPGKLRLYNAVGTCLREIELSPLDLSSETSIENLASGLYYWSYIAAGVVVESGKLVKE